jgi:hypothetical protein
LFCGPKTEAKAISKVKGNLVYEDYNARKNNFTVVNDTQDLDSQGEAPFNDIRFPHGTRLKMVRLQFSVQIQHLLPGATSPTILTLESNTSEPFIVMTNENQWEFSAGILLKKEAFDGRVEISWPRFANTLQLHYLRATRQDVGNPARPLSKEDLDYVFTCKFFSKSSLNQKEFEEFWEWFGKALHKIRHQKSFCSLWLRG